MEYRKIRDCDPDETARTAAAHPRFADSVTEIVSSGAEGTESLVFDGHAPDLSRLSVRQSAPVVPTVLTPYIQSRFATEGSVLRILVMVLIQR
jgi:hypothetical protein